MLERCKITSDTLSSLYIYISHEIVAVLTVDLKIYCVMYSHLYKVRLAIINCVLNYLFSRVYIIIYVRFLYNEKASARHQFRWFEKEQKEEAE